MQSLTKTLLALSLGIVSFPSFAEECDMSLLLGGLSRHGDRTKDHNEENWGVGVKVCDYALYTYYNSNRHQTVLFFKDFLYQIHGGLSGGFMIGGATNYTDGGEPNLAGMLRLHYQFNNGVFADLQHLPNVQDLAGFVTHLNVGYKFDSIKFNSAMIPDLDGWSIGYSFGFPSGQLDIEYELNDKWSVRGFISNAKLDWQDHWYHNEDKPVHMDQSEHLHFQTTGIVLEYEPWDNGVSFYGGLAYNNSDYNTDYHIYTEEGGNYSKATVNLAGEKVQAYHGDKIIGHAEWDKLAIPFGVRYNYDIGVEDGWSAYIDLGGTHFFEAHPEVKYISGFASQEEKDIVQSLAKDWVEGDTVKARYSDRAVPNFRVGTKYKF